MRGKSSMWFGGYMQSGTVLHRKHPHQALVLEVRPKWGSYNCILHLNITWVCLPAHWTLKHAHTHAQQPSEPWADVACSSPTPLPQHSHIHSLSFPLFLSHTHRNRHALTDAHLSHLQLQPIGSMHFYYCGLLWLWEWYTHRHSWFLTITHSSDTKYKCSVPWYVTIL